MDAAALDKVRLGTSGWSYDDWVGPLYPEGTSKSAYLPEYARRFGCVEVDSTFYAVPAGTTVRRWSERTPEAFRFALKVPGAVTHGGRGEKPDIARVLADGDGTLDAFLDVLEPLAPRVACLVFQFPYFRVREMERDDFLERLDRTLDRVPDGWRVAVEVRNKRWVDTPYLDFLAGHRAAAVMVDHPWMPAPRQQLALGMVTTDFAYIRLLGDRYRIEETTTTWDREVVDRTERLQEWSDVIRQIVERRGIGAAWAFANNHYAGHAPGTVRRLLALLQDAGGGD